MKPLDFQRHDLDVLARNNYTALLNWEPGAGKTVAGAFSIKESGASTTLIIAPDQTHETAWIPTVAAVTGQEARPIGGTGKAKKQALNDLELGYPGIYLVSPQMFTRADVSLWSGDLAIVDEGHLLNSAGSKGQRKISGYTPSEVPNSIAARFDGRLFLSGTAWRNSFERAWATMRFLWPDLSQWGQVAEDNYYMWQARRMDYEEVVTGVEWFETDWDTYRARPEGRWGKVIDGVPHLGNPKTVKKYLNESDPGLLLSQMPCALTHFRRAQCCEFHPTGFLPTDAPQEVHVTVPLNPAQKKAIRELESIYMTWLDNQPLTADLSITQQQRIRQMALGVPTLTVTEVEGEEKVSVDFDPKCASPFADELIRRIQVLDGEPVVIYMESARFASVTVAKLEKAGIPTFEYSGRTKSTRDGMLAQFGKKYQAAVVVLAAGGTGLDGLQKVTKTEFWLERSVDETVNVQAEARTDRLGGIGQVQRYVFHDDEGRSEGRMNAQLEKRRSLAQTLRKR